MTFCPTAIKKHITPGDAFKYLLFPNKLTH